MPDSAVPRVSIIITAHNYGQYLAAALDSALGQHYEHHEVVVVDDGSTDGTPQLLAGYAHHPRLRVLRSEGIGLAAASNLGIRASRGQYIVRLDADDWFDPYLAVVEADYLNRHPDIGMVFCDIYETGGDGHVLRLVCGREPYVEDRLLDQPCLAAGAMYRRDCYLAAGGYDENLKYQEDYDFWMKMTRTCRVARVPLPLMYYRRHGSSMSTHFEARMAARRQIKRRLSAGASSHQKVMGIVPWVGGSQPEGMANWHEVIAAVEELRQADRVRPIYVLHDAWRTCGALPEHVRPLAAPLSAHWHLEDRGESALFAVIQENIAPSGALPDALAVLLPGIGGFRAEHVNEMLDTLWMHGCTSVLAMHKSTARWWRPGRDGLEEIQPARGGLQLPEDQRLQEVPGLLVVKLYDFQRTGSLLGTSTGYIETSPPEIKYTTPACAAADRVHRAAP
jgi:GT2 family glycosyltransferase